MVVVQSLEYLVDLGLRVAAAGLECLRHLVEQQQADRALGGQRRDPAIPDERAQPVGKLLKGASIDTIMTRPRTAPRGKASALVSGMP